MPEEKGPSPGERRESFRRESDVSLVRAATSAGARGCGEVDVAQPWRSRGLVSYSGLLGAPASERDDRLAQGQAAIGQRVGTGVVSERQAGQDAGRLELAQTGREHVRGHSELALQITVALRPVEQPLHDEQGPAGSDDVESCSQVAHAVGWSSGFIQNGE